MPEIAVFNSWSRFSFNSLYRNDGSLLLPSANSLYAIICNNSSITSNSSMPEIISSEIIRTNTNNYQRFGLLVQEPVYDSNTKRWNAPAISWNAQFNETIQFNAAIILAGARIESNLPIGIVPGNPAVFNSSAPHGLAINEEIIITADVSGSMPSGLVSGQVYRVRVVSSPTQFQISTAPNGIALQLSSGGMGLRLRYAKGQPVAFRKEDSLQTLNAQVPAAWSFDLFNGAL